MISTYMQKLRLFNRDVRLYLVSWAIVGFNHMGIIAVLFNLYMLRLGHGPELVGVVNGTGWFAFSLSSLPAGALGKRWGSRTLMIVGMSVVTIGVGLTLAVELLPFSWQPIWLVSTYVLTLVGAALYFVSTMPFLTSATTEEERSHAYGIRTALNNFSGFVGSLVAGILPGLFASFLNSTLDDPAPYRYPLWISCILYAACVIILFRTSKRETSEDINPMSSAHAKDEANKVAPYALIALIAIVMLLTSVGSATINNFFNVYLDTELAVSTLLIGVLSAIKQLLSVLLALSAPILMARWEKDRIITFGFFIRCLSLLPIALIPHWTGAGLGYIVSLSIMSLSLPVIGVYQQESVSPEWRVAMSGAVSAATGLSGAVMAYLGAYIITRWGYRELFLFAAILVGAGALLFLIFTRSAKAGRSQKRRGAS